MNLRQLIEKLSRGDDLPDDLDSYLEDFIPNVLLKSETLQEAYGVSDETMEKLYARGHTLYEENTHAESLVVFRWLVMLNPFVIKYWMGLAANQQILEHYEKALHSYAVSALLNSEDPLPHFYAYHCYRSLDNKEDAVKALNLAYSRTVDKPIFEGLKKEIKSLQGELCSPEL